MSFSPPVVGYLLNKKLTKGGGSRAAQDDPSPPGYAPVNVSVGKYFSQSENELLVSEMQK